MWSGNVCYVCFAGNITLIFALDLDNKTIEKFEYHKIGTICDLKIENGVLFVCTIDDETKIHVWQRIQIRYGFLVF